MFLYYFSIPNVMHHLSSFLTMPLIKLWSNNLLTVYYSIPSLRWCTLWQLVMVHISPWFANFIDPNNYVFKSNYINKKIFYKTFHCILFLCSIHYFQVFAVLGSCMLLFSGSQSYLHMLSENYRFVCLFVFSFILIFFETNLSLDKIQNI